MGCSTLTVGSMDYSWPYVTLGIVPILLIISSPGLWQFPYIHELINTQLKTQGRQTLCWSQDFSLHSFFFSDTLPCEIQQHSQTTDSISTILENCWARWFPPLYTTASQPHPFRKLMHSRDHFIYFPVSEITVLHWLIPDVLRRVVLYTLSTS